MCRQERCRYRRHWELRALQQSSWNGHSGRDRVGGSAVSFGHVHPWMGLGHLPSRRKRSRGAGRMTQLLRRLARCTSAASAAEMALVMPLLLLLLFGIIDAGRLMWEFNEAEKATQV